MVAAMHIQNENDRTAFGLRTNELRNVAIGFAVAIALIMVAGQITDSGSASGSDTELTDSSAKRFVSISITSVASDNVVTTDEADAGFQVVGVTDELGETVTCNYGGVTDAVTADASTGAFTCLYDDDGTGTYADMSGVANAANVIVYATVSSTDSGNVFVEQDITDPTVTITTTSVNTPASGGTTNTCLLYTSPSPRDRSLSRMPSSA